MATPTEKTCTKCGQSKPLDAFNRKSSAKDGRRASCRVCQRAQDSNRIASDRDRYREIFAARNARQREYRAERYRGNREAALNYQREWRFSNPDRAYAQKVRKRAAKEQASHAPYSRADIFAAYAHECVYCGAPAEHLDHVVPISKGGADAAHNLLPACAPCNLGKSDKSLADWALTWCA